MCSRCEVTEEGFCFCGTSNDPQGRTEPCGAKTELGSCDVCGHLAGYQPMDTSGMGSDFQEY